MRSILFLLLFPSFFLPNSGNSDYSAAIPKIPVSCSPAELKSIFAVDVFSAKDGNWYDANTWVGGKVPAETDRITVAHNLYTNNQSIVNRGKITARKGSIEFRGIDESRMIEIGSDRFNEVRPNTPGIWTLDGGQLDLEGEFKTPFAFASGNVLKGATSINIPGIVNWKAGDEIVINPTTNAPRKIDDLSSDASDFNRDAAGKPLDPYAANFERRFITSVSGNTVSFSGGLLFDHSAVDVHGKIFTALIVNLTRSFEIRGTKTGYTHIYIHSTAPQKIKYIGVRYFAPGKSGLYGLHFHHSGYGSAGSVVEGNSLYDGHGRAYVPHMSHGITFSKNVGFNTYLGFYWFDPGTPTMKSVSHNIKFLNNYAGLQTNDGVNSSESMFLFGQGDGNVANDNIGVRGDKPRGAVFAWQADNEAVWRFAGNMAWCSRVALEWWQNTPHLGHTVDRLTVFNVPRYAVSHGAYGNSVRYNECVFQNTNVQIQASSSYTLAMAVDNSWMKDVKLIIQGSAIPSGYPNMFRKDTMVGNSVVEMYTPCCDDEHMKSKKAAFINCVGMKYTFHPKSGWGSEFYVQENNTARIIKQSGTTASAILYPDNYGSGDGLKGTFYNGNNFNSVAWTELSPVPGIAQASIDMYVSPDGLDHRITDKNQYSVRWEGFIQPHYTGLHSFQIQGAQGYRLWIDNKLILDDWIERSDTKYSRLSSQLSLTKGVKVPIKIETFNSAPPYEFHLMWLQNGQYVYVPQSQLYSTGTVVQPPVPPANKVPTVNAGADIVRNWTDTTVVIDGTATDPDGWLTSHTWSKVSGGNAVLEQKLSDAADVRITGLKSGVYVFRLTVKDDKSATASDDVQVTVGSRPIDTVVIPPPNTLQANAGRDTTITGSEFILNGSGSTGSIRSYKWEFWGGSSFNFGNQDAVTTRVNQLKPGVYTFNLRVTGLDGKTSQDQINVTVVPTLPTVFENAAITQSFTCPNGSVLTHSVAKGKYKASSQSAADALALQEINTELAKCPKPIAEFPWKGKTVQVYEDGETLKLIIK